MVERSLWRDAAHLPPPGGPLALTVNRDPPPESRSAFTLEPTASQVPQRAPGDRTAPPRLALALPPAWGSPITMPLPQVKPSLGAQGAHAADTLVGDLYEPAIDLGWGEG